MRRRSPALERRRLLGLVLLVVLCLSEATQTRRTKRGVRNHHHHKHHHHERAPAPPMPGFGFPPMGFPGTVAGMPTMPGMPGVGGIPGMPGLGAMAPRFQEVHAGTAVSATTQAQTQTEGKPKDLVQNVYNLLSKSRDSDMEDGARLHRMQEENQQLEAKLKRKAQILKERSSLLSRLEYCLLSSGPHNKNKTAEDHTRQKKLDSTLEANRRLLRSIKEQTLRLQQEKGVLDQRDAVLVDRENRLRKLAELLRKQQLDFQRRVDEQNARVRAHELALSKQKISKPLVKVKTKVVHVPKIVYKPAPTGCEAISDCGTCTANGRCGWCESSQKCLPSVNGTSGDCDAAGWNVNFCKMQKCIEHVHCQSCMADPRCGMCSNTANCMAGSLTGPSEGTCSAWNYAIDLRFMSYNIYGRDLRNCTGRAQWIFKMLREGNADFIALQEVEDWFLDELSKEKWALDYHTSDFGSGHAPGGLLVMSKVPLESVSYYEKTDPGQIEVDQRARMLTVRPKMGSRNLVIATTTLDWRNADNRASSLDFLFSVLNTTSDAVLMGDFNFDAMSMPETQHVPSSYVDVWSRLHPDQKGYTWDPKENSYAKESDPTSRSSRIDRMLVQSSFWDPSKISKIGCPEASPHYGLLGEFSVYGAYC